MRNLSWRVKLAALFALVLGTSLAFQLFFVVPYIQDREVRMTEARQAETARTIARELNNDLARARDTLQRMAARAEFRNMDIVSQHSAMTQHVEISELVSSLFVLDAEGWFVSGTADDLSVYRSKAYADERYFIVPFEQGEVCFSSPRFYSKSGIVSTSISVPIESDTGERVGVLLGGVRLNELIELVADYPLAEGETAFVVDTKGTVVAHSGIDLLTLEAGPLSLDYSDQPLVQATRDVEMSGSHEVEHDGVPSFCAHDILKSNGWVVMVLTPRHVILAASKALGRWLLLINVALFAAALSVSFVFTRQITAERKRAEKRDHRQAAQAALIYEVGRRVSSELELAPLLSEIVIATRDAFEYHGVMLLLLDEQAECLALQSIAGAYVDIFPQDLRLALGEGMTGYAAATGVTQISGDVSQDPHYVRKAGEPTKSELAVPVKSGQNVIGVLDLQSDELDAFDETDVMLMETLANQVGAAIKNARLYETVQRELVERTRAEKALRITDWAMESSLSPIALTDLQGNLTYVNSAFVWTWGYEDHERQEKILGRPVGGFWQTEGNALQIVKALRDSGSWMGELVAKRKDGSTFDVQLSASTVRDETGQPICMMASFVDITERLWMQKALEQQAHDLDRQVKAVNCLYGISRLVAKPNISLKEILQSTVELIPPAWQYPEITCARTVLEDQECRTDNMEETTWKLASDLVVDGERIGLVEVLYLEERPESDDGPFLKEERSLLNAIAARLGRIIERHRADRELLQLKEFNEGIVQGVEEALIIEDASCIITFVNPAMERLVGYTSEELIGADWRKIVPESEIELVQGKTSQRSAGVSNRYETRLQSKDGREIPVLVSASPLFQEGTFRGVLSAFTDITDRKRAEEQLQRYAAELEQANEEVKNFAYIVSHDLRAPLVNLKGFASELRSATEIVDSVMDTALPHLDEQQRQAVTTALQEDVPEALSFIESSATHMDHFINALLKLSRLGRRELNPELIDMDVLVQEALHNLTHQLDEHQAKVTVEPLPDVMADRTSMEQIIGNILGNAVKYLDPGRPGEIAITAKRDSAETTFRIQDNGRGIPKADMPKVFAPFRRAGKQDTPGEGMGLAYVQALVRRHGGRIWCESELGVGTTFTFTISDHIVAEGASRA